VRNVAYGSPFVAVLWVVYAIWYGQYVDEVCIGTIYQEWRLGRSVPSYGLVDRRRSWGMIRKVRKVGSPMKF
jgi:hypothetical protein